MEKYVQDEILKIMNYLKYHNNIEVLMNKKNNSKWYIYFKSIDENFNVDNKEIILGNLSNCQLDYYTEFININILKNNLKVVKISVKDDCDDLII